MIKPKSLFLIDSLGAMLTAVMLGLVLPRFKYLIGMQPKVLYGLSIIGICFAIFSFSCYHLFPKNWRALMKTIAGANLLYCILTFFLVLYNISTLSALGHTYFIVEIIIISTLVVVEFKTATFEKQL